MASVGSTSGAAPRLLMVRAVAAQLIAAALILGADAAWAQGAAPTGPPPLTQVERRTLAAIVADPPPPKLLNNQHYVVSDEHRPERFRPAIDGRGSLLVGVGTDQNYLFAGWARPELVVVVDFDQAVVDLHTAYRAFFERAEDADEFIDFWSASEAARERAAAAIAEVCSTADQLRRVQHSMKIARHLVHGRLTNLRARFIADGVPTLLNDPAQYRYVASLVRSGRVVAVRGDVTGPRTMKHVAESARQLGLVVRVLYLSNVEQYVRYSERFRDNVRALPVDGRSVVLRTYHQGPGRGYVYAVQRADHFRAWLLRREVKTLGDMLFRARMPTVGPLISLAGPPR
ncbi:MAG: hypothetical protein JRI23_00465 [Deltaproteobacteria bacterium]|jgi:hypothetical protein|nr:hypothetical protein [Deltaproteobacteria bacterium]MBW2529918.1 hypothetical protein [Deltaproteobacteria bacterium]